MTLILNIVVVAHVIAGFVGLAAFAAVRQSIRAVQTRARPDTLRTPMHLALAWLSIVGSLSVILFHTAFAVFGLQRIWDYSFAGALGVLPWTLPTLVGVPGIVLSTRYYRRKLGPGPVSAGGGVSPRVVAAPPAVR